MYLYSVTFHFDYYLRQPPRLFQSKLCRGNHMSVVESADSGIHH